MSRSSELTVDVGIEVSAIAAGSEAVESREFIDWNGLRSFELARIAVPRILDGEGVPGRQLSGLSLVIPAYNEEKRIGRTLSAYIPVLDSLGIPFEVLVVIDGKDQTEKVVSSFASRGVRHVRSPTRLGKGGALLTGFRNSRYSIIGYVDADGSLSAKDLSKLIFATADADCVIGSRWAVGSEWGRREPLSRQFASRAYNLFVRGVLGLAVNDTQCGAKFYRRALLEALLQRVTVSNLTVDTGFLFHTKALGKLIHEVPVEWSHDNRSRFRLATMIPLMFLTVVGIRVMNSPLKGVVPSAAIDFFYRRLGNL